MPFRFGFCRLCSSIASTPEVRAEPQTLFESLWSWLKVFLKVFRVFFSKRRGEFNLENCQDPEPLKPVNPKP